MAMTYKYWTAEEDEFLKKHHKRPISELMNDLNRTYGSVSARLYGLGLSRNCDIRTTKPVAPKSEQPSLAEAIETINVYVEADLIRLTIENDKLVAFQRVNC